MPTASGRPAPAAAGRSGVRRWRVALATAVLGVLVARGTNAVDAQAPLKVPGGYPPPAVEVGDSAGVGDSSLPAPWQSTPGFPAPMQDGAPFGFATPIYGGMPLGGAPGAFATTDPLSGFGAPAAGSGAATPGTTSEGETVPVRLSLSPATLMLADGGRAVAVALLDLGLPLQRVALDLRFDADRVAVTAINVDPVLSMNGAQIEFKHRLEPGRLRLLLVLTAADPAQLPTGSPGIATVTMAALSAGAAELTLNAGTSSVTTSDGRAHDIVSDAPVTVIVNDAPSEAMATEVAVQSDGLVAASAPAGEMGGGGGGGGGGGTGVAGMARDVANRLSAALGGLGGGDSMPLLAWLSVLVGAAVITGLGYFLGRAPEPTGPRVARGLRGRRRGGVDIEHEVVDEGRERR